MNQPAADDDGNDDQGKPVNISSEISLRCQTVIDPKPSSRANLNPRPITSAVAKRPPAICRAPATIANTLNGAGGGRSDATRIERKSFRSIQWRMTVFSLGEARRAKRFLPLWVIK